MLTVKEVKEALSHYVDQVSRKKDGTIVVRRGYFYRQSATSETFMQHMVERMNRAGLSFDVVDYYDHWAAFNGSASLARSSHFAVVFKGRDHV